MSKPVVKGPVDGNIYSVMGAVSRALKDAGQRDKVGKMQTRVMSSSSYDEALSICMEYADFDL